MKTLFNEKLGMEGRMISFSKSFYRNENPNNLVVFNSNIIVDGKKIWWGDIDVTINKINLIFLAKQINNSIFVLSEMDGRFNNEESPIVENYLVKFNADETYEINEKYNNYIKL